jgi:hypothetical protein
MLPIRKDESKIDDQMAPFLTSAAPSGTLVAPMPSRTVSTSVNVAPVAVPSHGVGIEILLILPL